MSRHHHRAGNLARAQRWARIEDRNRPRGPVSGSTAPRRPPVPGTAGPTMREFLCAMAVVFALCVLNLILKGIAHLLF